MKDASCMVQSEDEDELKMACAKDTHPRVFTGVYVSSMPP